jgi:hypothetical protein
MHTNVGLRSAQILKIGVEMNRRLLKIATEHKILPHDYIVGSDLPLENTIEKIGLAVANDCMLNAWWTEGYKDPEKTISNKLKQLYNL